MLFSPHQFIPLLAALVLFHMWGIRADAHPHVFVEPSVTLVFDDKGLAGVRHRWVFDDMFSIMILGDYDTNYDMVLDPAEIAALKSGAFDNISEWHYFTYLWTAGQPQAVECIQGFTASVHNAGLTYEFFVPFRAEPGTPASIAVFDPDYYVDFLPLVRECIELENAEAFTVKLTIRADFNAIHSDWLVAPTVAHIEFSKK